MDKVYNTLFVKQMAQAIEKTQEIIDFTDDKQLKL